LAWKSASTRIRIPASRTFTGTGSPNEVEEVLRRRGEDVRAGGNSRRKIGQTSAGRYLQIFYVPDEDPGSVFVITAYEPQAKARKAFRRRQRRKPK
jgi:hypothetical protein